ncbi:MAG: Gfo/Idh/MocA family oxidoreductase [Phycisphaerae bacterium]|nr:Gfo/Idh/MocA family oxidoreductase [Phycisphaerae bacterium]
MKFKLGIIGATGFIGTPYREEIRQCSDDAEIIALCARRRDRLEAAAKLDGAQFITDNWREVVEHPHVDTVLVLTPDALHLEPVLAAAAKGKHVVCEKPIGANAAEASQMWQAYKSRGLGHFVPLWARCTDVFVRAKEMIREGQLGDIKAFVYRWQNPRPESMPFTWRDDAALSSAGSIADVGTHAYDAVRWLLQDEAIRVCSQATVLTPPKPDLGSVDLREALDWAGGHSRGDQSATRKSSTYDYATLTVECGRGALGVFVLSHATYLRKGFTPELELHGTKASIGINRVERTITLCNNTNGEVEVVHRFSEDKSFNRFKQFVFPALRARIAGNPGEFPGIDDGWRSQVFTDAAVASVKSKQWEEVAPV